MLVGRVGEWELGISLQGNGFKKVPGPDWQWWGRWGGVQISRFWQVPHLTRKQSGGVLLAGHHPGV